jgi:hypothetical protein
MSGDFQHPYAGIALFIVPVLCALFLMSTIDLVVLRDEPNIRAFTGAIRFEAISPRVAATMYHLATSLTILALACVATLWICFDALRARWSAFSADDRRWIGVGVAAAILLPGFIVAVSHITANCEKPKLGIDDCLGNALLHQTIRDAFTHIKGARQPVFTAGTDSNYMAFVVLLTYFIGALTCAAAANARLPNSESDRKTEFDARMRLITTVLVALAVVMTISIIAMKLRFDIGLATLSVPTADKPNPAYTGYQALASSITMTWAWFLSIYLAAMYVPAIIILRWNVNGWGGLSKIWAGFDHTHLTKVVQVLALLAPPIVAEAVKLLSA